MLDWTDLLLGAPHVSVERWLLASDDAALRGTGLVGAYRRVPLLLRESVELCCLLVYASVPLGAVVLMLGSRAEAIEGYWAAVFGAELACDAMLPWVQTRPPRAIEREEPVCPLADSVIGVFVGIAAWWLLGA
ncbi:MAG: hypothetical protein AB7H81_12920 [Vicinamibacterales bacterium]